ncbi:MAG TPA: ComF family protein [Verrucomicrobiae bacterium]
MRFLPPQLAEPAAKRAEMLLGLFYPNICQLCEKEPATKAMGYVGEACRADVKFIQAPMCDRCGLPFEGDITQRFECTNCKELDLSFKWSRASVVSKSEGTVLEVIHRFKYNGGLWFEPFLVELWLEGAKATLATEKFDLIVPVPLHPHKEREREFNQAERLVRAIAKQTNLRVGDKLIERVVDTRTQTRLDRKERAANVKGAFAMRKGLKLNGERILVVDDVLTTGATTSACAKTLLKAGAGEVCVWTVARGL